ncbi:MAG: AAA family ATPase [bacterium]
MSESGGSQLTAGTGQILRSIVRWSRRLPAWQRDALRRLFEHGELTDADLAELLELCKAPHHLLPSGEVPPAAEPLHDDHVAAGAALGITVSLKGIRNVRHVNALTLEQTLKFRHDGLTIVYGVNGSGKSGYARVLKKACRTRSPAEQILPNIFEDQPDAPASATIDFEMAGESKSADWTDGESAEQALSAISVFDAACAPVHVEATNDVAYTPVALDILRALAEACRRFRAELDAEKRRLAEDVPAAIREPRCDENTAVARLVRSLSADTTQAEIEALATLSEDEEKRLESLKSDLANDPMRAAAQCGVVRTRLGRTIERVSTIAERLSDGAVEQFRELLADAETKASAAQVAATRLFSDEPLPGIGSETWRVLWDSARGYSTREVYPDVSFPVTGEVDGEKARCVLCQQELDDEAVTRFGKFEDFVRANVQQAADAAKRELDARRTQIASAYVSAHDCRDVVQQVRDELAGPELAAALRRYLSWARHRCRSLLQAESVEAWPALPDVPAPVEADLRRIDGELDGRIAQLRELAQSGDRRHMEAELRELEDRIWLASVKSDLIADVLRRQRLSALDACLGDVVTTRISLKSNHVAQALVTQALRRRFDDELRQLGVDHLEAQLIPDGSRYGVPRFRVRLSAKLDAPVAAVLSEGEHRCIALAAFLSELATADSESGIVFDDPVCSLDHQYREAFARRLVKEAPERQVIVFTHDLVFAYQLHQAAQEEGMEPFFQYVARTGDTIGICQSSLPPNARPVSERINSIQRHTAQATALFLDGKIVEWQEQAKALCETIRETWELAVEDALSPVFRRFDAKVKPVGLRKVAVLSSSDCDAVEQARQRCSAMLHSLSVAVNAPPPAPDQINDEIRALADWVEGVAQRQANT